MNEQALLGRHAVAALARSRYVVECFDKDGRLRWREEFDNLVTTAGLNALLDNTFTAAASGVNWYVGLVTGPGSGTTFAAGDTLASHAGWTEATPYSGNRPAWTRNGAASGGAMSNSSSKASFAITANATIAGAFLCSVNTGTSGILYGEGDFAADRAVLIGDTLNVQIDPSVAAA